MFDVPSTIVDLQNCDAMMKLAIGGSDSIGISAVSLCC